MTCPARHVRLAGMPAPLRLTLELDVRVQPMVGRVVTADGTTTSFTGWTGLVATLDRLAGASRAPLTPTSTEDDDAP